MPIDNREADMTPRQVEQWSVGIKAAISCAIFLVVQAAGGAWWLGAYTANQNAVNAALKVEIQTIQQNQAAGAERAAERQEELDRRLGEIVQVSRDRNAALDARVRPLEAQSAATTATLQAINNNLIQLGADLRDLRNELQAAQRREAEDGR